MRMAQEFKYTRHLAVINQKQKQKNSLLILGWFCSFQQNINLLLTPKQMPSSAKYFLITSSLVLLCTTEHYTVSKRLVERPIPYTLQYYLTDSSSNQISPWSQIDLNLLDDTLTCIIQIPKQSCAKMEMIKQAPHHPIIQDIRTSKFNNKIELRHYPIPLPLVNYGFVPMTWEQSVYPDSSGFYGDDDPIDIVDLSSKSRQILDIVRVKVLGAFCLIDQGELDWKVLVMDVDEAKQRNISSHYDLPALRVQQIMDWFKAYKTYEGKEINEIGFGERVFSKEQTLEIIFDTHVEFLKLQNGMGTEYAARKIEFNL